MTFPDRVALATKNPHKIGEILAICSDWPVTWVLARDVAPHGVRAQHADWPDVEETGATYEENARLKAGAVARATGVAAVADDSGIEVDALGGDPGPRSARFAGERASDRQNLDRLIELTRHLREPERTARYVCVAACAWPDGREILARASCEGHLVSEPYGSGGFGYDPIFVPSGETRTMAQLSPQEKHALSHRGKALRSLRRLLDRAP